MSGPSDDAVQDARRISDADLGRLGEFLYRRTGMLFGEAKRYYVERRLADRMAATGTPTFGTYLALLLRDRDEAEALINVFTVNETYFYREEHQLRCLTASLLPEVIVDKRPGDKIRVWSQPCSTGEEAYSIAIWLLENWRLVDAYNVEIVGSDVDTDVLVAAVIGDYGERSVSKLPPAVLGAYFEPLRGTRRRIIQDLRESVTFTQANLVERASMAAQGAFDVVFCRNVLIYFDDASRRAAADNLFEALVPGGFMCLGHSESMTRMSERFRLRRFTDAIVYQRPGGADG